MDTLRSILKFISRHSILSTLVAIVLAIGVMFVQILRTRSAGELSAPLQKGSLVDAVYGIGTVTAVRSYALKPGVISTINDIYVKEGDSVRKSAPLAKIDAVVYRAPFDGVVNFLPFKVGENVFTQIPVLVLTDLLNRYLVVTLEQQGALRVRAGQKAKLSFDSMRGQSYAGNVQSVYSYNGNFLARIDVSELPREVLPDMTADVAIVIRVIDDALLIPVAALEEGSVWVHRGGLLPQKIPVKTGVVDNAQAEVVSGDLHPGDQLILRKRVAP